MSKDEGVFGVSATLGRVRRESAHAGDIPVDRAVAATRPERGVGTGVDAFGIGFYGHLDLCANAQQEFPSLVPFASSLGQVQATESEMDWLTAMPTSGADFGDDWMSFSEGLFPYPNETVTNHGLGYAMESPESSKGAVLDKPKFFMAPADASSKANATHASARNSSISLGLSNPIVDTDAEFPPRSLAIPVQAVMVEKSGQDLEQFGVRLHSPSWSSVSYSVSQTHPHN